VLSIESANMVAYWPFNETAGITAVNAEGTVARDGTYTGVTLDSIAGPDGRPAGLWDGSNDYVNIYSSSLNSGWNPDEGTLSAWAKVLDNDTWSDAQVRQIVSLAVDENNVISIYKGFNTGRLYWLRSTDTGSSQRINYDMLGEVDWFHVAMTWSLSADEFKVYLNGVQHSTTLSSLTTFVGNLASNESYVGAGDFPRIQFWEGYLAHGALWKIALTADQILSVATV
jgi:hypothetical protein